MPASHYITLWAPDGLFLLDDLSDFLSLDCVLSEGNIGVLTIVLPSGHDYTKFRRDARLAYYRAPPEDLSAGLPRLVGNTTWLLVGRKRTIDRDGKETFTLIAAHPNQLLARRVVAYDEKTSQADKADQADDALKAYVRENFVGATDTARNWASTLFTVEADVAAAATENKAASYRTVLNVCQELAAAAAADGTYTNFEVFGTETSAFRLRTYTGQRGTNRSSASGQPLILSITTGAFDGVELEENWMDTATYVYAGGSGKEDERLTGVASDTTLIGESPYGRIEWFQNATYADTQAVVDDEAKRALRERRPRVLFSAAVRDMEYATFMEEYDWGDKVVGEFARFDQVRELFVDVQQFDCRVDPVHIHVERTEDPETGEQRETETLDIRLRSEA